MNIKNWFLPVDMTTGVPWRKITAFALPMLVGNIAQQLYSTVDSIVVGQYLGDNALAAVGSVFPLFNMILVLFVGIATGAGILVAQYFGAKERENLSLVIGNCITLTLISSAFIMALAPFIIRPLLDLLNTPLSIIDWAHEYLLIIMLGIAGMALYNILGGILRGLGDSMSALFYLLIATIINIVLDLYFVIELNLGVAGVAYATVIAQSISTLLCFRKLLKLKHLFDLKKEHLFIHKSHSLDIINLGIPSGLSQAVMAMAGVVVQSLANSYGELFISANVITMRVDGFAVMPIISFGAAMTTYAGQNLGARKYDRIALGAKQGVIIATLVSACITIIILSFGNFLISMFTNTEALMELSYRILLILSPAYLALAISQTLFGVMRGAGDTVTPMWLSIVMTVLIRVPLAYIIAYFTSSEALPFGIQESIHISLAISWLIGTILTIIAYRKGKWRRALTN